MENVKILMQCKQTCSKTHAKNEDSIILGSL